jgi:hypothetical protein
VDRKFWRSGSERKNYPPVTGLVAFPSLRLNSTFAPPCIFKLILQGHASSMTASVQRDVRPSAIMSARLI